MRKNNPAVYECPKGRSGIHTWVRNKRDGTATCASCKLQLSKDDTDDCFRGDISLNESPREAALREAARECVEALKPFAKNSELANAYSDITVIGLLGNLKEALNAGHLRRARAAIAKMESVL